jgi:SpoVK/Ycf46/Vps4 family AAA+-type ATPase
MPSPLQGDANRQAVDPIGGVLYQIWQSVFAWITLEGSEVLYLEGAEDFDIVDAAQATAVQVRRTAAPITLGLKKIIEVIVQFWALRKANPAKRVAFRYLTTSEPGYESGSPFGAGMRGLDVWEGCKKDPKMVESVMAFLLNRDDLQGELRLFLQEAPPEQVLGELIMPIAWVMGQRDTNDLQNAISDILIVRGEDLGVQPYEVPSIAARLFQEVCNTVIRSQIDERVLTRSHFLKIFEQATSVSVSRSKIQRIEITVNALARSLSQIPEGVTFVEGALPMQSPPSVASDILERNELVESAKANLERLNLYLLSGGAGTGKTTIAAQIAESWQRKVVWMTLRGLSSESVAVGIRRLTAAITRTAQKCLIVMDDIDFLPASFQRFEPQLASLLLVAQERGASILFSSQRPFPRQFSRRFNTTPEHILRVPMLSGQEIREYCAQQGCPATESDMVAANILVRTRGHPTLVHALLKQFVLNQWSGVPDYFSTDYAEVLNAERGDARQLLSGLPEPARELLYRLSLIEDRFRRDHALKIGELEPAIAFPGDRFDQVVGPWIEPLGSGYHQISPLLSGEAEHIWSVDKCRKFHEAIAEALLTSEPRTVIEANTVLRHAWKARSLRNLYRICGSLSIADSEVVRSAFGIMVWFATISLDVGDVLLEEDPQLSGMLRSLQYRIARQADERLAEMVLSAWRVETEKREANPIERFILSVNLTVLSAGSLPPSQLLSSLETIQAIENTNLGIVQTMERGLEREAAEERAWNTSSLFEIAAVCALSRYKDVQEFEALIAALLMASEPLRMRVLRALAKSRITSTLLVDRIWMTEAEKGNPDWRCCLKAFGEALTVFANWNQPYLVDTLIRGVVVIKDEYLGRTAEALEELDHLTAEYKRDSGLLRTARITALSSLGRWHEVIAVAQDSVSLWEADLDILQIHDVLSLRSAAVAASNLRDWKVAAELFERAYTFTQKKQGHTALGLGLRADAAFARWNAGAREGWIQGFSALLEDLEAFAAQERNKSDAFRLRKLVGVCFLWILAGYESKWLKTAYEPPAGACSKIDVAEELYKLPDNLWWILTQIDYYLEAKSGIEREVGGRLDQSPFPAVAPMFCHQLIQRSLKAGALEGLPEQVSRYADACSKVALRAAILSHQVAPVPTFSLEVLLGSENSPFGKCLFSIAMLRIADSDDKLSSTFASWREFCRTQSEYAKLLAWMAAAQERLALSASASERMLFDPVADFWSERIPAAINLTRVEDASASQLLVGQLAIVQYLHEVPWISDIAPGLAELFVNGWRRQLRFRGQFSLPTVTIPDLEKACSIPDHDGLVKAAKIVHVASRATNARLSAELNELLGRLASNPLR